jgi:hypothetical protein
MGKTTLRNSLFFSIREFLLSSLAIQHSPFLILKCFPLSSLRPLWQNHFPQNKPNFKTQQNALTPFPIAGCWKLGAGSRAKNKPKQTQFPNRLTANC